MSDQSPQQQNQTIPPLDASRVEVVEVKETNVYSILRTLLLTFAFLACLFLILFLIYLNGKGVYESGI